MVGLKLSNERQALHDGLVEMCNKIMAHSDSEMMCMTTQPFDVSMQDGEPPIYFVQMVFDEGVTLRGDVLVETNILLREVYQAIYGTLHRDLQTNPELFKHGRQRNGESRAEHGPVIVFRTAGRSCPPRFGTIRPAALRSTDKVGANGLAR